MESRKIIALVEDVDAARSALKWAVQNLLRFGDVITLLHVYPSSRSKNRQKQRNRRLNGFQLALSFKDLCQGVPEAKVEIVVTEGDQGATVMSLVEKLRASTLVVGLHDRSFIYRTAMVNTCVNNLNCRVLAVKQTLTGVDGHAHAEISQIDIRGVPEQRSHSLQVFLYSLGMFWRCRRKKGKT
ncbi:hypothetical protein H6P81_010038 [Aristolochia fimbriata]|uniref:UspA domain-containing protein n=1 Tax=Aristolochia fimbriata TaxID=158543 RepID=A0AAV7EMU9_ARIFI|nr:hypothetical protein H6P81_010038 [Aristolochia fimbriata]